MLVFRYDKSFDGLLSALFDAYSLRAFPEALIGPGEPEPLFTERVHEVVTDEAHAARVWRGLERRLIARTRSMIVYAWHGEQPQSDLLLLRCLRRIFDEGGGVMADQADPAMKSLYQLALKVSHERERLKQFVRLQKAADGTYFAAVTPEHNALPLGLDYFTDRFADQRWLIYDRRQTRRRMARRRRTAVPAPVEKLFPGAGHSPADQRASAAPHDAPPLLEAPDRDGVTCGRVRGYFCR